MDAEAGILRFVFLRCGAGGVVAAGKIAGDGDAEHLFGSAEGIQPARAENRKMKVVNRRGSYQQPPAARQKKAEGKKRKSQKNGEALIWSCPAKLVERLLEKFYSHNLKNK